MVADFSYLPRAGKQMHSRQGACGRKCFWKTSSDADENLPWPQPDEAWKHREAFLQALDRVEAVSRRITYCGVSPYRLCGVGNGRESIRLDVWEWPEGFDTMLPIIKFAQHPNFEIFVTRWTPPGTVKTRKLVPRYGSRVYRPPTGCTKNVQFPVRR